MILQKVITMDYSTGDEFYLKEWPQVEGYSFRDLLTSFPAATPIGVKEHSTERVVLNPEDTYIIQNGECVVQSSNQASTMPLHRHSHNYAANWNEA